MKIMVIGGGKIQSALVEEIRAGGDASLVIDRNRDCYCADKADTFVVCDTGNHVLALEIAKQEHIDGVLTAGTDVGYTVSYVAQHMGLHACHPSAAYSAKNKARMRDLIGLDHPAWKHTEGKPYDWEFHAEQKGVPAYPCVLKPVDMSASRGVSVANSAAEFQTAYWRALQDSNSGIVIVEEALGYVDGRYSPGGHREVAVDIAMIDGTPYIVNSAERVFSDVYPGIEIGHVNPAFKGRPPEEITKLTFRAVDALGVTEGPFKMDLIHDERYGWCLLECATRWSGAFDHSLTGKEARGHNYTRDLINYALTGVFTKGLERIHDSPPVKYIACMTPLFNLGQLMTQDIRDLYRTAPGVFEVIKMRHQQEPVTSCAVRPLFVFAAGATPEEAWCYLEEADNHRKRVEAEANPTHIPSV